VKPCPGYTDRYINLIPACWCALGRVSSRNKEKGMSDMRDALIICEKCGDRWPGRVERAHPGYDLWYIVNEEPCPSCNNDEYFEIRIGVW